MAVKRTIYENRDSWLAARADGLIGASEISCVMGVGFQSSIQLWQEKMGYKKHPDLSDDERVAFGNAAEAPLRSMFRVMHPEYELDFTPYMIVRQAEGDYTFLSDTPDGELIERETGRRGLYESKTATCIKKAEWDEWREKVPQKYYCQICQGMYCGDYDFAVIWALLRNQDGDGELRYYHFERADAEDDIAAICEAGKKFYDAWQNGTLPPNPLPMRY